MSSEKKGVQTVDADGHGRVAPSATPVHLPLALVIEKGREAYLAGRLGAQTGAGVCMYRAPNGSPCVIGAALDDATARWFDRDDWGHLNTGSSVGDLIKGGVLTTDDETALRDLQAAHDVWVFHKRGDHEQRLRRLLGLSDGASTRQDGTDPAPPYEPSSSRPEQ